MKLFGKLVPLLCFAFAPMVHPTEDTSDIVTSTVADDVLSPTTTEPVTENTVEKAVNSFGLKLVKTMLKNNENQNVVVSPMGVFGLLAMTLLGSAGTTYDELAKVIGFSQDILANRRHHEEFGSRLQTLDANDTKTLYANAVFVDQHSRLRELFRSYLQRIYRGDAFQADFEGQSEKARQVINEWVSNHTNHRLENFLQEPLPGSTKAVLLSALYFSGQWAVPFVPKFTLKLPFTTPTKEVLVDMMANFGRFNYILSEEDQLQMIAFPYNDTVTTMYVIKPTFPKKVNISSLLDRLSYDRIDKLIDQLEKKKCVIRFPKMVMESKVNLKDALRELGARALFTPGVANFAVMLESDNAISNNEDELLSRIGAGDGEARALKDMVNRFANPGVHVDSVMHEVKITIDEYGTEAVAATSGLMTRTAETFNANTPFYLFIRNEKTKLVTFSAVVLDPSLN